MKTFFAKLKTWIVGHKVVSIVLAAVLTAGIACAIVLPIALKHKHEYATVYTTDATNHWHACECGEKKDLAAHEANDAYVSDETNHWHDCTVCGYDLGVAAHAYNQEVATSAYLKTEATTTTKSVYYKSCVCGKAGVETFEADKTAATITDLAITDKTYDATAITAPTYTTDSEGAAVVEYKAKNADDTAYTTTAPIAAGEYTVRVSVAETVTHASVSATKDFRIAPIVIDNFNNDFTYNNLAFQNIEVPAEYLAEADSSLTFLINFSFVSKNVGAAVESLEIVEYVDYDFVPTTNYVLGNNVTASIVKKGLSQITVTKVYDGNATISDFVLSGMGIYDDDELFVSGEFNSANVNEAKTLTNVVLFGASAGNYEMKSDVNIYASITKAQVVIADIIVDEKTYDGNPINEPNYFIDAFADRTLVEIDYKVKGASEDTYTSTAPTDAGTYTVRVGTIETANYESYIAYKDFTIARGEAKIESVEVSAQTIVYGDSFEMIINAGNFNDVVTVSYKIATADDETYDNIKPTNAGSYVAKVTIPETNNYTGDEKTVEFTINAKELNDLYEIFFEDGNSEFTFDLEEIEAGLSITVTFEDSSVAAEVKSVVVLKDGNPTQNYTVNLEECYFAILSKVISTGSIVYITPTNYTINLMAGKYVVEVGNVTSNRDAQIEIYSKLDESTPVYEFDLTKNFVLEITEMQSGEYILKVLAEADGYIMINEHNVHDAIDDYGFCGNCGEFTGMDLGAPTGFETVEFTEAGKKFLRFDVNNNYAYGLQSESDDVNYTVTVYGMNADGTFHQIELTETVTKNYENSFDDHFYIVIEAVGAGAVDVLLDEQDI